MLASLSGSVSDEQKVLFNLQSVANWPSVARFLYDSPHHRHRIARRLSSPNLESLNQTMIQRYGSVIDAFIESGEIEHIEGDTYAYLGERKTSLFEVYYPIVFNATQKGVSLATRVAKKAIKKIESLPEQGLIQILQHLLH